MRIFGELWTLLARAVGHPAGRYYRTLAAERNMEVVVYCGCNRQESSKIVVISMIVFLFLSAGEISMIVFLFLSAGEEGPTMGRYLQGGRRSRLMRAIREWCHLPQIIPD